MFKNVGKKIRGVSNIVFTVEAVVSCLFGTAVWLLICGEEPEMKRLFLGFLAGVVIAAGGVFVAWLSQLLLQAYGKITECCEMQLEEKQKNDA